MCQVCSCKMRVMQKAGRPLHTGVSCHTWVHFNIHTHWIWHTDIIVGERSDSVRTDVSRLQLKIETTYGFYTHSLTHKKKITQTFNPVLSCFFFFPLGWNISIRQLSRVNTHLQKKKKEKSGAALELCQVHTAGCSKRGWSSWKKTWSIIQM